MAKTVTVHAQQMWEYTTITRKTPDYLVAELNEAGRLGWELVSTFYHKETKTSVSELFCWTAFLKRPLILPAHAQGAEGATSETPAGGPANTGTIMPPDMDASIFDVQREELDDDAGPGNA